MPKGATGGWPAQVRHRWGIFRPATGALDDRIEEERRLNAPEVDDLDPDFSPYAELRSLEPDLDSLPEAARKWTVAKTRAMATEELEARLRKLGVVVSCKKFVAMAEGRRSAWSISEDWLVSETVQLEEPTDPEFLGFAACELWTRWLPERPSDEMLVDWYLEGARAEAAEAVCEPWWKLWLALEPRLTPQMRKAFDAEDAKICPSIIGFSQHGPMLAHALSQAALAGSRPWAKAGLLLCEQWLAHFPDEDPEVLILLAGTKAGCLMGLGEVAAAEVELRRPVERFPDRCDGYLHLGEFLADLVKPGTRPPDYAEALAVLEKGKTAGVFAFSTPKDFAERIEEIRRIGGAG